MSISLENVKQSTNPDDIVGLARVCQANFERLNFWGLMRYLGEFSSAPSDFSDGDIYYNSTDGKVYVANSSQWIGLDGGNVTASANLTDNAIVRGDGGADGVKTSGITIDNSNNIVGGSYTGTLLTKSISEVQASNLGIVDNDTLAMVFDFVPSKIFLSYSGVAIANTADEEPGHGAGHCVITVTGTDTITSNLNATGHYQITTGPGGIQYRQDDTSNAVYVWGGFDVGGLGLTYFLGTATWATSTKTLTITFQETGTKTAQNFIEILARAHK